MSMVQRREHERWEREADDAYSKHVIARSGKGFVYLKRPDSGCLAVELILGGWGTLIVIGDGPDMMFRSYRKGTLRSALEWVGHSGAGYISSKVVCGRRSLYSGALAHADYRAYIDGNWPASDAVDANGEVDEEVEGQRRLRLALLDDDCIPWFEDDIISRGEVEKAIYQIEEDAEVLPVGVYASFDFRNARAACRRAIELMGTQDAELSLDTGDNESPGSCSSCAHWIGSANSASGTCHGKGAQPGGDPWDSPDDPPPWCPGHKPVTTGDAASSVAGGEG